MKSIAKTILFTALLAVGLSACTSREEAIAKIEQEGVIDFEDGWKLYLQDRDDLEHGKLVRRYGPTYVYTDGEKDIFTFSCSQTNNFSRMQIIDDLGTSFSSSNPMEYIGAHNTPGIDFGGFALGAFQGIITDQNDISKITIENGIVPGEDTLGRSANLFLTQGMEFTHVVRILDPNKYQATLSKIRSAGGLEDLEKELNELKMPQVRIRPYKLPPIQNPGLYAEGDVCQFTWEQFDPRDIDSHRPSKALQLSDSEVTADLKMVESIDAVLNKYLNQIDSTDNKVTINGKEINIWQDVLAKTTYSSDFVEACQEAPGLPVCIHEHDRCLSSLKFSADGKIAEDTPPSCWLSREGLKSAMQPYVLEYSGVGINQYRSVKDENGDEEVVPPGYWSRDVWKLFTPDEVKTIYNMLSSDTSDEEINQYKLTHGRLVYYTGGSVVLGNKEVIDFIRQEIDRSSSSAIKPTYDMEPTIAKEAASK